MKKHIQSAQRKNKRDYKTNVHVQRGGDSRDHIHMLVNILPKLNESSFTAYLREKSGLKMYDN